MKRAQGIWPSLLLAWLLLASACLRAQAQPQFTYDTADGAITITGYLGTNPDVTIPGTLDGLPVTAIGDYAFAGLGLTNATLPDSLVRIGAGAFSATQLSSLLIPSGVTSIGDYAFTGTRLATITLAPGNPAYRSVDGVLFNFDQTALLAYPQENPATAYVIPDGVLRIGAGAFNQCQCLTGVTIPASVTGIGENAFAYTTLTNLTIPNSVTNVGDYAFANAGLTRITIPNGVTRIGTSAFNECMKLALVTLPDGLTNIGDFAFYGCLKLTAVTLPNSVTTLGAGAFAGTGLTRLSLPAGVTSIGDEAFASTAMVAFTVAAGNSAYRSVGGVLFSHDQTVLVAYSGANTAPDYRIPNGVTRIAPGAFEGTRLPNVTIPTGVLSLGDHAFAGNYYLKNLILPDSLTSIGDYAFESCSSLTSITIPNRVNHLGAWVFHQSGLTKVTLPDSLTSISDHTFYECHGLGRVTIPVGVTSIGDQAFTGGVMVSISVADGNPAYRSVAGVLFDFDQTTLIAYPAANRAVSYVLPDSVTRIADSAFSGCFFLTRVTLPGLVTSLGDGAFAGCEQLAGVFFKGDAPAFGQGVFDADIVIPKLYYLPGTSGWAANVAGVPAAWWNLPYPVLLSPGPGGGTLTNGFNFQVSWATNLDVIVEAGTELPSPAWQPLLTNRLAGGVLSFSDPEPGGHPGRFYRARSR
ncbi:MAG TPA: leucine-rich repeat protein [Candidatus Limnocylindria bacterium]|nr:leucine-rich repeat protein [Candidatus Limnocylindria bacterium]